MDEDWSLPTVVYVRDGTCPFCHRFEKHTLADAAVRKALELYGGIKALDEFKDAKEARRLGYTDTPSVFLVDNNGAVLGHMNGCRGPNDFIHWLKSVG